MPDTASAIELGVETAGGYEVVVFATLGNASFGHDEDPVGEIAY